MIIEIHCAFCSALMEVESQDFPKGYFPCPSCNHTVLIPRAHVGPGTKIGRFEIDRYLGSSFTGRVYLARQMSMNRPVALKVLAPVLAEEHSFIRGFITQVIQAGLLRHPHIVSIYDAGESGDGLIYVAMRYVEGHSLAHRLEQSGALPEAAALALIRPLVEALNYAWREQKILHQDLKPSSILVDDSGEPQLVGLGASYVPRRGRFENHPDLVIGSPHYMSPERVRGDENLDVRTDIYSLGATLYELVTGELPFPGHNLERVRKLVLEQAVISPRERNPVVSGGCSRLIEKAMAKNPDHRYDSWESFAGDLDRVMAGQPPRAQVQEKGQAKPAAAHVQTAAGALARASAAVAARTGPSPAPPPGLDPPLKIKVSERPHKVASVHIRSHDLPHPDPLGQLRNKTAGQKQHFLRGLITGFLMGGFVFFAAYILYDKLTEGRRGAAASPSLQQEVDARNRARAAEARFRQAEKFAAENPMEYDRIIANFRAVMETATRQDLIEKSLQRIEAVEQRRSLDQAP